MSTEQISTNEEVYKLEECRACKGNQLFTFLQLGPIPAPNAFLEKNQLSNMERFYPLDVCLCQSCGLVQLAHVVDPVIMFKNYVYIPSTSVTMQNHFSNLAKEAVVIAKATSNDLVIDIGSNDGTLLKYFKSHNMQVIGIDPAENLSKIATGEGIRTINAFFTKDIAQEAVNEIGKAKIITATNVFAHVNDISDFIEGVKLLLDSDGIFIAEFPYLVDMIEKIEFDTIYPEHLSYFSVTPLKRLFEEHDLNLFSVAYQPVHGGSIRIFISKDKGISDEAVRDFIKAEADKGMLETKTYLEFQRKVDEIRHELVQLLWKLRLEGNKIVGYGASAKGNIILNYCRIGPETLDYIVDSIPYKHGKFTPGMHIPIYPEDKLIDDQPNYALLLAWNYAEEIIKKQANFKENGGKFIISIPEVRIV